MVGVKPPISVLFVRSEWIYALFWRLCVVLSMKVRVGNG